MPSPVRVWGHLPGQEGINPRGSSGSGGIAGGFLPGVPQGRAGWRWLGVTHEHGALCHVLPMDPAQTIPGEVQISLCLQTALGDYLGGRMGGNSHPAVPRHSLGLPTPLSCRAPSQTDFADPAGLVTPSRQGHVAPDPSQSPG